MTAHEHERLTAGCYRCELNRDEVADSISDALEDLVYDAISDTGYARSPTGVTVPMLTDAVMEVVNPRLLAVAARAVRGLITEVETERDESTLAHDRFGDGWRSGMTRAAHVIERRAEAAKPDTNPPEGWTECLGMTAEGPATISDALYEAAPFHGLAQNSNLPVNERLMCALRALDIYEAALERERGDIP